MTDSIGDLLGRKRVQEPPEIRAIKDFVRDAFQSECSVILRPNQIIISVQGAALAATLRMHITELQAVVASKLRIVIRIGN